VFKIPEEYGSLLLNNEIIEIEIIKYKSIIACSQYGVI
jgi:hypothetical protein